LALACAEARLLFEAEIDDLPWAPFPQVDGETISQIGPGLLVLLGLLETDTDADSEYM
jgi:hypothetical protein